MPCHRPECSSIGSELPVKNGQADAASRSKQGEETSAAAQAKKKKKKRPTKLLEYARRLVCVARMASSSKKATSVSFLLLLLLLFSPPCRPLSFALGWLAMIYGMPVANLSFVTWKASACVGLLVFVLALALLLIAVDG